LIDLPLTKNSRRIRATVSTISIPQTAPAQSAEACTSNVQGVNFERRLPTKRGQYSTPIHIRCAVYTRKSSEEGLDMEFNSLDAQRESCEAYVASQRQEGWVLVPDDYDDGGFSGGTLERPALKRLLADIEAGLIDVVVVYKIDRLSRSLMDFSRLVEVFDRQNVTFVSITQSFNTTTSMGRLTLNILLSFAQFEREVTGECSASITMSVWASIRMSACG
jgi:predicted site-specific integrase-resolvase